MFRCGMAMLLFTAMAFCQKQDEIPLMNAPSRSAASPFVNYQNNWGLLPPGTDPQNRLGAPFLKHLVEDQKTFWTSPFRMQKEDAKSGLPFFLATTGVLRSEEHTS